MALTRPRLVVVGHGMVAHRLVSSAIETGLTTDWDIVVLGEEPRAAYDRVALTSYFTLPDASALALMDAAEYADPHVHLHLNTVVTGIDRLLQKVVTATGEEFAYDVLVLATGSTPFVPPIDGRDLDGVFVYRTIDDLDAIRTASHASGTTTGVVIGGGLLGLEAANALRTLGLTTHVVEMAPRLMPVQLDAAGGAALVRHIEGLGVVVHAGARTEEIAGVDGAVSALHLADEAPIETQIVVFSAGIRPRDQLARECGLEVGERGGIVTDESMRTNDPLIYAIGECAAPGGRVYGLVAPGYDMAEVVVDRLRGGGGTFVGADMSTKLKLMGVDVASFGDAFATTPGSLELVYSDALTGVYKKLVVDDSATRLLGGILVGDASAYGMLRPMVTSGLALPENPEDLILPAERGSSPVKIGLPDEAVVCSCNNVTKATLCSAIDGEGGAQAPSGCLDVGCLKSCTRAGTTCGSCVPMMTSVLTERLAAAGVSVSKGICEHFSLTRQELFDVILVRGLTSFVEVLADYGSGRGCDVCKPAIASILASQTTSAHVLAAGTAQLQDTNDAFLANIQRNGTYSVVPRIPGGEITPDGLITIGEVARDFGLYTKITGGQRIDLFGARVEELPAIWARLVDAGFESGHAYGKSLRTVKSCVGSTWCRFGVQDSVKLAIDLELRYRGLRSPHKLKSGVSGCARECAEARGKDFGIIATEKGWNLYVGGNGGFNPAHAKELATDLDTETLIRYVDRFLMFYIRTADRLQRVARWIEEVDGGLDYVRSVVVDDALGIAADLEAAMERHVAGYADEWAGVLSDPDKLQRFVSFVNAPGVPDPAIAFVPEREQVRPATADEVAAGPGGPVLIGGARIQVGARQ